MLGRLFHAASSTATSPSGTRPSTSHANESDEIYTKNLLYPDVSPGSSVNSSYNSNNTPAPPPARASDQIDLDLTRDVRVILAQDGSGSEVKAVLYDSKPSTYELGAHDGPTSPNMGGGGGGGGGGPYGRNRRRNPQNGPYGAEDELRILTDCMFGSAPLAYKGPSTKVHILPTPNILDDRRSAGSAGSPMVSRRGSLRERPQQQQQQQPIPGHPAVSREKRKSVLITRLFSVVMPSSSVQSSVVVDGAKSIPQQQQQQVAAAASGENASTPGNSIGSNHGFPFPKMAASHAAAKAAASAIVKPPKTSMYAIGLIISLPANPNASCSSLGTQIRCCYHKPFNAYDMDYSHRHEYCCPTPPSFDDEFPSLPGSLKTDSGPGWDDLASVSNNGSMELVTRHWDVITRALSDLQRVAQVRILETLSSVGVSAPQATQNGFKYRKKIELRKMALMRDEVVRTEVERLRWRIVSGIKVPRVVVGQGKWDLWQDEAMWANGRFGGRDRNFFFLTLLTAFLGHHTAWLDGICPDAYKRRHNVAKGRTGNTEDSAITIRTVILANDKIAARRLIYLLSAFLPAKPQPFVDVHHHASRSSSINYLSQSPPNFSHKMGSNCRKMAKKKPSKLNMVCTEVDAEHRAANNDVAGSGWDIPSGTASATTSALQLPLAQKSMRRSGSTGTLTTNPSSATITTTSTGALETPQKVATRPGSRDSSVSLNLMNTLRRSGTANTSVDSTDSRWGSFLSFWSNPKSCSSTGTSEPDEHVHGVPRRRLTSPDVDLENVGMGVLSLDDDTLHPLPEPFSPIIEHTPLRCSVDDDGTVNVDVPLGPNFASIGSPLSSPPTSWSAINFDNNNPPISQPSLFPPPQKPEESTTTLSLPPTTNTPQNVVGYLDDERFHPDFLIQALKPSPHTDAEIRRAMHMEPAHDAPTDDWATVAEVLIADAIKLQIRRLRLKRCGSESRIEEEVLVDVDDTLATAIERVIGVVPSSPGSEEDVRCAVMGALEKVVTGVIEGGRRWEGNVLTEGVGRWLDGDE